MAAGKLMVHMFPLLHSHQCFPLLHPLTILLNPHRFRSIPITLIATYPSFVLLLPVIFAQKANSLPRPCKGRKVKCDETHPICNNCEKVGETCDYSTRLKWEDERMAPESVTNAVTVE